MKSSTLSRLISRGILPEDPRFHQAAEDLEEESKQRDSLLRKTSLVRGLKKSLHLKTFGEVLRWLSSDGRAVRVGRAEEIEIWESKAQSILCVRKTHWTAYRITQEKPFQLRGRLL